MSKALSLFDKWFTSAAGVYQTTALIVGVCLIEAFFPHLDKQGFLLLYWLTVWSAVTQNMLAYSNKKASEQAAKDADHVEDLLARLEDMDQKTNTKVTELSALVHEVVQALPQEAPVAGEQGHQAEG